MDVIMFPFCPTRVMILMLVNAQLDVQRPTTWTSKAVKMIYCHPPACGHLDRLWHSVMTPTSARALQ
jgi:hypothetical protein